MKKRKLAVFISGLLVLSTVLGGCGKKEETVQTSTNAAASKEHVYKMETLELKDLDMNSVNEVFFFENRMVAMGYKWETVEDNEAGTEGESQTEQTEVTPIQPREGTTEAETASEETAQEDMEKALSSVEPVAVDEDFGVMEEYPAEIQKLFFAVYDYEGNQLSYNETELEANTWIGQCEPAVGEEAIYCISENYFEDSSDPDNYIWEEHRNLVKKNPDGTDVWSVSLDEFAEEEQSLYVNSLVCDKQGQILLFLDNNKVLVYSKDSELVKEFKLDEENSGNVMVSDSGKVMINFWGEKGQYIKELDTLTGELSEEYTIPGNSYNYSFYPGYGYDLFLTNMSSLYGYNLGDETVTELMNFVDSDLDSDSLYNIFGISNTQFYASYYSYTDGTVNYGLFTKVDPKEIKDKKLLTLACNYIDYNVRKHVVEFNKSNENYRIQIKDYSVYNTEDDYTQAYTKLNTDIVSGNVPDILQLNSSLPVESYIAKGLFEDLYPYIDADEELDRSKLLTNVMDAFSTDGKLYKLVPTFSVITVAGKTADVGTGSGWTLDELNALVQSKPEGTEVFYDSIRSSIMANWMQMSSEQFINWETGECNFNSEGFVKLLEFVKPFPESWEDEKFQDESYWEGYDNLYRDGKALLSISYLSDFAQYNRLEKGTFGEPITLIGFPSDNKKGSAFDYNTSFAMSAKSAYKDGAWEFLRYFLTYEYQKETWGFPTNMERYEELKKEAMQKPYYLDENNNKVEYDDTYYVNGLEVIIPPMTEAEVQKVEDFIFSIDQTVTYDEDLLNIIMEEAEGFFAGQKSAKEVADIIQSRARIYVNENR